MSYYERQRERWEQEEREFTLTVHVTKYYETEVTVNATSEESALAQYEEMKADVAGSIDDECLIETEVELESCADPVPND